MLATLIVSFVLSTHVCETGDGGLPCIDILLSGQAEARVGDIINVDISIVAQQDKDATAGRWAGLEVVLGWNPDGLEPIAHTVCNSPFDYFMTFIFISHEPGNLLYDCVNQDFEEPLDWVDNDGDLVVTYFAPLGSENDIFAIPQIVGTMQFRVLAEGNHTVSIIPSVDCFFPDDPQAIPVDTKIVGFGNTTLTGDITDTYEVEVRNPFDTEDPVGVGIEDLLALLAAWGQ